MRYEVNTVMPEGLERRSTVPRKKQPRAHPGTPQHTSADVGIRVCTAGCTGESTLHRGWHPAPRGCDGCAGGTQGRTEDPRMHGVRTTSTMLVDPQVFGCAAPGIVPGQGNTQECLSKLKTASPQRKIGVTSKSPVGDISVVTLIRTDTTLDHSQKAEKVWCTRAVPQHCRRR